MLLTLAGRHVCISKQLHLFSYEFQCGLTDLANTQIPTNFSVEFPKKSVCVRLPLTPLQVFPSWIHLPLLGPTVTQLHTSLCPFASPLSSVCCNPRYYTLPVQIRSVGPLKSLCMEWNPLEYFHDAPGSSSLVSSPLGGSGINPIPKPSLKMPVCCN